MPKLAEQIRSPDVPALGPVVRLLPSSSPLAESAERAARGQLRAQIRSLERELSEIFATACPQRGIGFAVGAAGGPRVLGLAELEQVRDALAGRLGEARSELARRAEFEEANRALIEQMIAWPAEHRWIRVSNEDLGEGSCRHWHSRPRWGIRGALLGWWRVKLSSGCPLATGRGLGPPLPD